MRTLVNNYGVSEILGKLTITRIFRETTLRKSYNFFDIWKYLKTKFDLPVAHKSTTKSSYERWSHKVARITNEQCLSVPYSLYSNTSNRSSSLGLSRETLLNNLKYILTHSGTQLHIIGSFQTYRHTFVIKWEAL